MGKKQRSKRNPIHQSGGVLVEESEESKTVATVNQYSGEVSTGFKIAAIAEAALDDFVSGKATSGSITQISKLLTIQLHARRLELAETMASRTIPRIV